MDILEDIFDKTYEEKRILITKSVNAIIDYLKNNTDFDINKIHNFIFFILGVITNLNGGLKEDQFDIFKEAVGIQYDYDELTDYLDDYINVGDEDYLLQTLETYPVDILSNVYLFSVALLSVKGEFTDNELDFLEEMNSITPYEEEQEELSYQDRIYQMQDYLMAQSRDKRIRIADGAANAIIEKMSEHNDIDRVHLLLMKVMAYFIKLDYGDDHLIEYEAVSSFIKIEYDVFIKYVNEDVDDKKRKEYCKIIKKVDQQQNFVILGMSLASVDGIMSEDVLKFALEIYEEE